MCGLFGYLGKKQKISFPLLNMLGIDNDSRGGDSCGIFIDGKVEYGTGINKFYELFYNNSKLLKEVDEAEIILGHDRKASIGNISEATAQPVVIYNEKHEVDFAMIHNGTIHNYVDLAKKYLGEYEVGMTDSQVMAKIIYLHGYDVLEEYNGSGAFVFVDYRTKKRKPQFNLFRGESLVTKYSATTSEERPLFYIYDVNGIWFSSISTIFHVMCFRKNMSVFKLPTNKLVTFENNQPILIKEYDRTNKTQTSYSSAYPNYKCYNNDNDYYIKLYESKNTENKPEDNDTNQLSLQLGGTDGHKKDEIYLNSDFLYCVNGKPAHGMKLIDENNICGYKGEIYNFYHGVLLYNSKIYNVLTNFQDEWQVTPEKFFEFGYSIIYSFSNSVYYDLFQSKFYRFYSGKELEVCGKYVPMFQNDGMKKCYIFNDGNLEKTICNKNIKQSKEFQHLREKFSSMTEKEIKDKIENMFIDLME